MNLNKNLEKYHHWEKNTKHQFLVMLKKQKA